MNTTPTYKQLSFWIHSTVNSYAVVFFSSGKLFGLLLILASFVSPVAGLCGMLGALLANTFAAAIGLSRENNYRGYFGYDAMLVSCALATFYQPGYMLMLLIFCAAVLSVLVSGAVNGVLQKYQLPSLSFPFLFTIWILLAAMPSVTSVHFNTDTVYVLNTNYRIGGFSFMQFLQYLEELGIPDLVKVYFKSLSSLFFQSNILSGMIIATGLLLWSRIAFSLSVIGYTSAYFFYMLLGGRTEDFYINFVGLNFIFQAIAIGGFFIIPSAASYIAVVLLTPLLIVFVFACNQILYPLGLAAYSLPFTLTTLLFLYLLKLRPQFRYLHPVQYQSYSPEQNLYNFMNANQRMRSINHFPVNLPFWGEWMVSQAHNGKITHLGDWSKAFDFIVLDEEMKSYSYPGTQLSDYYCFDKPVVACADGYVSAVEDNVEDNRISDVNTVKNWGNSVVIWHTEGLYSQVSHLKKDSIKVKVGDHVKRGDIIGMCGSSGRSPEPHIHFQLQSTPAIGARTLDYPLAYYLVHEQNNWQLRTFDRPKEGETISNVETNPLLKTVFNLIPGTKLRFIVEGSRREFNEENWEVFTDSYNYSYIYCHETKALAYFYTDGSLFYFTEFYGSKKSLLYYFYLAHYKVLLGFYQGLEIRELYPVSLIRHKALNFALDIIAPFYMAVKTNYTMQYDFIDDVNMSNDIKLCSSAELRVAGIKQTTYLFETNLTGRGNIEFIVHHKNKRIKALCVV